MIKNVVFDLGKVLVAFDWDILARKIGFTEEEIKIFGERVVGDRWDEFDRGVMSEEEVIEYIEEVIPGMEEKFEELWHRVDEAIYVFPYVDEWIKDLKERGYNIYVLSNFPPKVFLKEEAEKFHFLKYADGKVISGFVKMIKPDREMYEYLLRTYDLKAEESIFIDDRPGNIEGAKNAGLHGIVFESYEKTSHELDEILKKNER